MKKFAQLAVACVVLLLNGLLCSSAQAEEFAQVCWLTETQSLMRFNVTQSGQGHYTYTGIFDDGDDEDTAHYAITGSVEVESDGAMVGTFSGSKSTQGSLKTFVASVTLNATTLGGTVELNRIKYDRMTQVTKPDYRTHTLTRTTCPT